MKSNIIFITGTKNHNQDTFNRYSGLVGSEIVNLRNDKILTLGGTSGCEHWVRKISKTYGIPVLEHAPWDSQDFRTQAGHRTCTQLCDKVIVFWDGNSDREAVSIRYAEELGKPCKVIRL